MNSGQLIANQWIKGEGAGFASFNPATGNVVWNGEAASRAQVHAAVAAARTAFPVWRALRYAQRLEILLAFRHQLENNKPAFAQLIAEETGKPLWESLTEVGSMIAKISISDSAYQARTGEHVTKTQDVSAHLQHRPHGVVAILGPYNFPGHLPNGHIVPALLAGNTIVFKPSELTPAVAAQTLHYWQAAGLPMGVINLVQGGKETGEALAQHPDINGLFFTGSYSTGKTLHKLFAGQPEKILALEMGGNNPLVVGDINNIAAAVYHTIQSAFITAGQRCTCARRLIIIDNATGNAFLQQLIKATAALRVGAATDVPEPFMGPVISAKVAEQLLAKQAQLVAAGGKALLSMRQLTANTGLLSPGIIDVTAIKQPTDEEIFGPLLQVIKVSRFAEALVVANATGYGLSAGLFSEDPQQYAAFTQEIRAGIVNWNRPLTGASSNAPFGGVGYSGNHRPSAFYAADYCAYPVASLQAEQLSLPAELSPGIVL